jgi:hypothetical protein
MRTLESVAPNLAIEVEAALTAEGRVALVPQVASAKVDRCTYDEAAAAGYICFIRPSPSPHFAKLAAPVAETIAFLGFNVDVRGAAAVAECRATAGVEAIEPCIASLPTDVVAIAELGHGVQTVLLIADEAFALLHGCCPQPGHRPTSVGCPA